MLIVFLKVFPTAFTPGVDFLEAPLLPTGVGVCGNDDCDEEGARKPLFGKPGIAADSEDDESVGMLPVLFRVFVVGNAGKADVGGPNDGLEGLGNAAAMLRMFPQSTAPQD